MRNNLAVPTSYDVKQWSHLTSVAHKFPPAVSCGVGLLLGFDSWTPIRSKRGKKGEPRAVLTDLGWSIVGPLSKITSSVNVTHQSYHLVSLEVPEPLKVKQNTQINHANIQVNAISSVTTTPREVIDRLESGFTMPGDSDPTSTSQEDTFFIKTLTDKITQDVDGFYSMHFHSEMVLRLDFTTTDLKHS